MFISAQYSELGAFVPRELELNEAKSHLRCPQSSTVEDVGEGD